MTPPHTQPKPSDGVSSVYTDESQKFSELLLGLSQVSAPAYVLAELDDFLVGLSPEQFAEAVQTRQSVELSQYLWNYVAAMVEEAAQQKGASPPRWVWDIEPLKEPVFITNLLSLRLHLLLSSPPPYLRRNIFIDTGIGGRV